MRFGSKPFYLISLVVNKYGDMACRLDVDSLMKFTLYDIGINKKPMTTPFYRRQFLLGPGKGESFPRTNYSPHLSTHYPPGMDYLHGAPDYTLRKGEWSYRETTSAMS
jgi:hypothetical protein